LKLKNSSFVKTLLSYKLKNIASIKDLLSTFGPLRSFNLVRDAGTGQSKGFGFCEYARAEDTDRAIQGLHGMQTLDRTLQVQRAQVGARNPSIQGALFTESGQLMGIGGIQVPLVMPGQPIGHHIPANHFLNVHIPVTSLVAGIKDVVPGSMPPLSELKKMQNGRRSVVLLNAVAPNELEDPDNFEDVVEDLREECAKMGTLVSLIVPRLYLPDDAPPEYVPETVPGLGKVFMQYETAEQALDAVLRLGGRVFDGRHVVTTFMDDDDFDHFRFNKVGFVEKVKEDEAALHKLEKLAQDQAAELEGVD